MTTTTTMNGGGNNNQIDITGTVEHNRQVVDTTWSYRDHIIYPFLACVCVYAIVLFHRRTHKYVEYTFFYVFACCFPNAWCARLLCVIKKFSIKIKSIPLKSLQNFIRQNDANKFSFCIASVCSCVPVVVVADAVTTAVVVFVDKLY